MQDTPPPDPSAARPLPAGTRSARYQSQSTDSAQGLEPARRLGERWREALDLLDAQANDPSLNLLMTLRRGDIPRGHNHTLRHGRSAFERQHSPA